MIKKWFFSRSKPEINYRYRYGADEFGNGPGWYISLSYSDWLGREVVTMYYFPPTPATGEGAKEFNERL